MTGFYWTATFLLQLVLFLTGLDCIGLHVNSRYTRTTKQMLNNANKHKDHVNLAQI